MGLKKPHKPISRGDPGVKSRMCPPYPQHVKGDKMGRFLGITV